MIINERLANGLKNRFFTELSEEVDSRFQSLLEQTRGAKNTRAGWARFSEKVIKIFDRCSIVSYEGGSKRKPYFGICSIHIEKNKPYNSWNEKCLTGFPLIACFEPRYTQPSMSLFNVSEHAISRIFQRSDVKIENETDVDIFSILPEFSLLPLWAMYWARMISELAQNGHGNIRPVIPTPNGLFLAEISIADKVPTIEVRTFVDIEHLTDLQKEVRSTLLEASDGIQSSPLVFYPGNEYLGVEHIDLQLHVMSFRIYKQSQQIGKIFFHHIDDDGIRFKSIEALSKLLKYYAVPVSQKASDNYKNENVRLFHSTTLRIEKAEAFNGSGSAS